MKLRLLLAIFAVPLMVVPLVAQGQETELITVYGAQTPELDPQRAMFSSDAQLHTALSEGFLA